MNAGDIFNPKGLFFGALIPNWLLRRKELSGGAKLVYARLLQYCNHEGRAFPKLDSLASETGCSLSGVKNSIAALVEYKLIAVEEHRGSHESSDYYFLWHSWMEEGFAVGMSRQPEIDCRDSQKLTVATARNKLSRQPEIDCPLNKIREQRSGNKDQGTKISAGSGIETPASQPHPLDDQPNQEIPPTGELDLTELDDPVAVAAAKVRSARDRIGRGEQVAQAASTRTDRVREANAQRKQQRRSYQPPKEPPPWKRPALERAEPKPFDTFDDDAAAKEAAAHWDAEMLRAFPDAPRANHWSMSDGRAVREAVAQYSIDQVKIAISYLIRNWVPFAKRNGGDRSGALTPMPYYLKGGWARKVFTESVDWEKYGLVVREHLERPQGSPLTMEEMDKFNTAKQKLRALGIEV